MYFCHMKLFLMFNKSPAFRPALPARKQNRPVQGYSLQAEKLKVQFYLKDTLASQDIQLIYRRDVQKRK